MRILQLIYESFNSPFGFGGAGVRAYEIYRRLSRKHDITLLCMRYPGAKDGIIQGLRHKFIGTESDSLPKSVLAYTINTSKYIKGKGNEYDIIIENFLPATPFLTPLFTKTPTILQIQGIMKRHTIKKYPFYYALPMVLSECFYPYLYRNFIFVTETGMDRFKKRARMFTCIPNGVSEELLKIEPKEGDYILFLSRIDKYTKGLDILMKAFAKIADRYRDLKLVLGGYQFDSFEEIVHMLPEGLRTRVRYVGFITSDEKIRLLSEAKLFVLPSRHEAHPISLLEAMACGKAVVVSEIPELRFVREQKIGITFRNADPVDLEKKLTTVLNDPELRQQLGKKARQFTTSYLWDNIAINFEMFLEEVLLSEKPNPL